MKIRRILEGCALFMIITQAPWGWAQEKSEKRIIVGVPAAGSDTRQQAPRAGATVVPSQGGGTVQRPASEVIEVGGTSGGGKIQKSDPFATGKGGMPIQPPQTVPILSPAAIEQIPSTSSSGIIPVPPGGLPQIPFIPVDPGTLPPSPFFPPGSSGTDPSP